ncbi:MAG: hypothetical protein J6328_04395 [Bacilli bacterium]|nr:hypothetical protein [Bacilli bacterium]
MDLRASEAVVEVVSTMAGPERELTIPKLFQVLQDIATENAEKLGVGKAVTTDVGKLWVVSRFHLEFNRNPKYLEKIKVESHAGPKRVFVYPRHFTISDLSGNVLIKASSLWALIDEKSRKLIMRPDLEMPDCSDGTEIALPGKVHPAECSFKEKRAIRYSDLDTNRHLNNTRYLEMLVNIFPIGFLAKNQVKSMTLNYTSEMREGQIAEIYASDDYRYIKVIADGQTSFEAELTFESRQ